MWVHTKDLNRCCYSLVVVTMENSLLMRITVFCTLLFLLVLPFTSAGGFSVTIIPADPVDSDALVCSTDYTGTWYPTWDVEGEQILDTNGDLFTGTTLSASFSDAGDSVTCFIWQPLPDPFDDQLMGSATVTIAADSPDDEGMGLVVG